ncbi:DUF979 domain-containing protein [uncultured Ilyobacter sp.]|uniref:DUF979 domain-containing protein n=1 Tax=uncultured Ilyobacter sp. TaxID=544433 RepID=UPI0029F51E16|nr:DUF979 domain-containing protein [uncultured Ilyobacter sp.]
MKNMILEIMYILTGLVAIATGAYALTDKKHKTKIGTGIFWIIFGVIFMAGKNIPSHIVGILIFVMGGLTAFNKVGCGSQELSSEEYREERSHKIGNSIFFPATSIGLIAFAVAQFTDLGGLVGLGLGSIISLIFTLVVTKENPKYIGYESSRMLQQIGSTTILPQLLASLGALFALAGVGTVISEIMSGIIPEGNILAGVTVYCLAMALFTMIMGNAFAAFAVITAGIGIPFVFSQGANPAIAGVLGLTAGYCGTLLTPMAANFNIVPAAIMEMKNKNGVIAAQTPVALVLLFLHIVVMYLWAF